MNETVNTPDEGGVKEILAELPDGSDTTDLEPAAQPERAARYPQDPCPNCGETDWAVKTADTYRCRNCSCVVNK